MPDNNRELVVLLYGRLAGTVTVGNAGRLTLSYDEAWLDDPAATPVSLSMPLAQHTHPDAPVRAFLSGLLPDNERVIERWARTYNVSAGNPFALLRHVGEDCAGAVQFVHPDRVSGLLAGDGGVRWLSTDQVAERLRTLRRDPAAWHVHDTGQFSLAGAQAKTALYRDADGRWGEPWGAVPTTHILKPAVAGLADHDLNEHLCLSAARRLGLAAATSTIAAFGDERVVVVERYDRDFGAGGRITRVHQEDTCQALGVPPTRKYQSDGGPSAELVVDLLRTNAPHPAYAAAEIARFIDALAFNWIVGGTDAHAKNYSVLLAGTQVRLAPLYDVASALVYDEMHLPKLRMAMKIGGEYRIAAVHGRHWRRLATAVGLDPDAVIARVDALAAAAADSFADTVREPNLNELAHGLADRFVSRISRSAAECRARLAG